MNKIDKKIKELKKKKVAVLGLGINNEKLVDFFIKNNLSITICDKDETKSIRLPHYSSNKLVSWKLGEDYLDNLTDFDIVFRSPGISYLTKEIQQAKKKGVKISSQTNLFFDLCPATIIGVTGTKGKGTTSTLIYEILKRSGKEVFIAGNIGQDPFTYLERLKKGSIIVLELSSFQLQGLNKSPNVAVVLNITIDHLDHHKDRKEYLNAKKSITKFQTKNDYIVTNVDYKDSKAFSRISASKNLYFSTKKKIKAGSYYQGGWIYLKQNDKEYKICSRKNIKLLGEHNLENITAATTASAVAGASIDDIQKAIASFGGLEHRLEYSGKVKGVKYYNDSFSTTPDTTIAAINSFDQPTILIAGGSDKGADFTLLAQEIMDNKIKALILIGLMSENILASLLKLKIKKAQCQIKQFDYKDVKKIDRFIKQKGYCLSVIRNCQSMPQVVRVASQLAESGDVVLLSPACASFGMFKNYKERGMLFKQEVKNLRKLSK